MSKVSYYFGIKLKIEFLDSVYAVAPQSQGVIAYLETDNLKFKLAV